MEDHQSHRVNNKNFLPYIEILGDIVELFNAPTNIIIQINNCISRKLHPRSFSWNLAMKHHYANPYARRLRGPYPNLASPEYRSQPGTIQIIHPPSDYHGPIIGCLYAQYKMGTYDSTYYLGAAKADYDYLFTARKLDTYRHRLMYFKNCLELLQSSVLYTSKIKCIVFPKFIGCGLAGGLWSDYEKLIRRFCHRIKRFRPEIEIYVVTKK